jgi:peptide methionine sulfoxide reductase msrA/msrB
MVQAYVFDARGELVGPVETPKWNLTDAEWRQRLSPEQFTILRAKGTERPFCGTLLDNKQQGVYSCAGCGLPLFASAGKFHSGTGWPSFFQPIAKENVIEHVDASHGMVRSEILCARCDGHLGHVFDDGPRPTGLRYCLNSESLAFTPSTQLVTLADPAAAGGKPGAGSESESSAESQESAVAVFAGGCFWCTEAAFEQLAGVLDVQSGYSGGPQELADYDSVCSGRTGHAEAIRITYDPRVIGYEQLLDVFFDAHDPTQLNRQGNDVGTQYRSAIFYADDAQRQQAEAKIRQLTEAEVYGRPIVTKLEKLEAFHPAEQYHQDYAQRHPDDGYIQAISIPKVCKVREKHAKLVRKPS